MGSRSSSALGAALCLLLAGCGVDAFSSAPPPAPPPPLPTVTQTAPTVGDPRLIEVPSIDARSDLVALGVDEENRPEVPPLDEPLQAGWLEGGPEPGEPGAAVIVGHINGNGQPGVFARLDQLAPGDLVRIDGREWTVYEVLRVSKTAFPTNRVFSSSGPPEIRLITCGGVLDTTSGRYEDNVIAFAR